MTPEQHGFKLNGSTYCQIFFISKYYSDTYCKVDWVCGCRNVVIYGWLQVTCADFQLHGDGCPNSLIVPGSIVFVLLWLADWLIWLSIRSSSFIHIVACIRISHFFFFLVIMVHYVYTPHFAYPFTCWWTLGLHPPFSCCEWCYHDENIQHALLLLERKTFSRSFSSPLPWKIFLHILLPEIISCVHA